jgi:transcriptional antiterminator
LTYSIDQLGQNTPIIENNTYGIKIMNDHISSLQVKILLILLDQKEAISANSLANTLDSKASTVRYNLSYIKELVQKFGGTLSARPKVGYLLEISPSDAKRLHEKLHSSEFQFQYSDTDRLELILFELLVSTKPLTLSGLVSTIGASKATLIQDLDKAEKWLQEHRLALHRQTRTGTQVVGEEIDLRHALVSLILEILTENDLLNICRWGMIHKNTEQPVDKQVQKYIISHIASWGLPDAWWLINRILDRLSYRPSDNRYLFLVLYWTVMLQRFQQGFILNLSETILAAIQKSDEYKAVLVGAAELIHTRGLHIPPTELAHFSAEIQTSPREPYTQLREISDDIQDQKATQLTQYFVESVTAQTGFAMNDPVIFRRLCKHLGRTITRLGYNLPIDNPFTNDVAKNYPEMWQAVCKAAESREGDTKEFSQEEIAYIAMYFILAQELEKKSLPKRVSRVIVACPSGGISIWMLVSRLQKEFPEVEIMAAISLRDLSQQDKSQADLIITTAHHVVDKELPVISVSPLLTEEDITLLKNRLANPKRKSSC